jgi:ribonuclease T2
VKAFAKYDLLAYMNKYWVSQGGPSPEFWAHEFSKHATCYSTFDVPCYGPGYVEHEDVIDFFQTAIMYYMRLPTHVWLANKGITPSNTTTYALSDMQAALTAGFGKPKHCQASFVKI